MTTEEAINNACRDLPEGYIINLGMENGAAWIEVLTPEGIEINIDGGGVNLADQIKLAVELAKADEGG